MNYYRKKKKKKKKLLLAMSMCSHSHLSGILNLCRDLVAILNWKPIIIGELSQAGYEVIFYGDASMRMLKPSIDIMIPLMLKFPLVPGILWSLPIVSLTHDGMLRYLKITLPRKELNKFGHFQAAVWAIWVNETAKQS